MDEEKQYFEAARRYPNLFDRGRLIMQQGCRPEELLEARKHAVDLTRGVLRIVQGKTKAARRTLKLTEESQAMLKRRLETTGPFVFPGKKPGTHPTKLNGSHNKVLRATGLSFVIYDLRHTFATRMAEAGMPPATLAAILGHSNLRSIMKYVHPKRGGSARRDGPLFVEPDIPAPRRSIMPSGFGPVRYAEVWDFEGTRRNQRDGLND